MQTLKELLNRNPQTYSDKTAFIFVQLLGQTETLNLTVLKKEDHNIEGSTKEIKRLESVGKPPGEGEVRIVDEQGHDVPRGEVGEIIARSDGIMKEYWKLPKETAETIKGAWLHTGDMGRGLQRQEEG